MSGDRDEISEFLISVAAGRSESFRVVPLSDELLNLAYRHGLEGLLVARLQREGLSIPPRLVASHGRSTSRARVMLKHLRGLLQALKQEGIPASVVKGPDVANWAYDSFDDRPFTDIDLVVPRQRLSEAVHVLEEQSGALTLTTKRAKADKRDVAFDDPSGVQFNVDLHWDLFSYSQLEGIADGAMDDAWSRSVSVDDHLGPRTILPDDVRTAFLATHAVLDHRFRLILFSDLLRVVTRPDFDGDALIKFAQQRSLRSLVWAALKFTNTFLRSTVPPELMASLRVTSVASSVIERYSSRVDPVRFDGHHAHPLNLAIVLLHDEPEVRRHRIVRAPSAAAGWRRRVTRPAGGEELRRIMIVVTSNRRRGAEVFGSQLSEHLIQRGFDVDLVSLFGGEEPSIESYAIKERAGGKGISFDLVRGLRNRVSEFSPQTILGNGSLTLRYVAAALVGMRPRPGFAYSSIGQPSYWLERSRMKAVHRWVHRIPDVVGAVSAATMRELGDIMEVDQGRLARAEIGVSQHLFEVPDPADHHELRVIVVGALASEKAPQRALEILSLVSGDVNPVVRFVGDGPLFSEIADHPSFVRRELAGSVDDVTPHLEWCDLLLLTSETEGLPGVVLEAAAAGRPAVVFDVGGSSETVLDGETGFVVPAANNEAAAERVQQLAKNQMLRIEMGKNARQYANSRFTMEHAVSRYERMLRQAWLAQRRLG